MVLYVVFLFIIVEVIRGFGDVSKLDHEESGMYSWLPWDIY